MRPDDPRCATCVAYHLGDDDLGWCRRKPREESVEPTYWCMKHETPEEWQAKKGAWGGLADAYFCADLPKGEGGPND